ncbi:MAG TPA: hypothetical protein VNC50_15580, partial [Planctomycetia bacterium]|nr:hypothetical protein [Planctomycetia bacterium]
MLPHADDVARDLETALWTDRTCVRGPARSATLVAFAHGYVTDARDYVGLVRVLANLPGKPDLRILHYGASRFRRGSPSKVSHELGAKLAVAARHYDEVLLCGHSMGGLFLREAYLDGLDKNSHWAHKVRLIVLLASTNRGFIPTRLFHRVLLFSVARAWWLALMALVAGLWLTGVFEIGRLGFVDLLLAMTVYLFAWTGKGGFLVEEVLRGADWIAALRLRWIDRFPGGGVAPDPPDCVHLR